MATVIKILNREQKPEYNTTKSDKIKFFSLIKEKLEFQKLQNLKQLHDIEYVIKSVSNQIKEVDNMIFNMKNDIPVVPLFTKLLIPTQEEIDNLPHETYKVHHSLAKGRNNRPLLICEHCNEKFVNRKLLKEHLYSIHAF